MIQTVYERSIEWVIGRPLSNTEFNLLRKDLQTVIQLILDKLESMGLETWNNTVDTWYIQDGCKLYQNESLFDVICDLIDKKERVETDE